jgi:soluble P-type ATPase
MIEIDIPGFGAVRLSDLVCGYNGTLAVDGMLLHGVADALSRIASDISIHVVTADTFGTSSAQLAGVPIHVARVGAAAQAEAKLDYVTRLGLLEHPRRLVATLRS